MNREKEIEQCLSAAPKPPAPEGLLDRLSEDVAATKVKVHASVIRRWFAPTGQSISLWRIAAAAAIVISLMLPLSYGAIKVIRNYFFVVEKGVQHTFKYGDHTYTIGTSVGVAGDYANEDEARSILPKRAGRFWLECRE